MVYYSLKDLIPKEIYFLSIFFLKIFKYTENLKETWIVNTYVSSTDRPGFYN